MSVFDKHQEPLADKAALNEHIELALQVDIPTGVELELSYKLVRALFNPVIIGEHNIPEQPCLFVGNHALFALDGFLLAPLFIK
ncbi:MAG: acyltransferase, partial [Pseudomonadota bacterium]